jgi:AcrR family transcriptional regulator
MSKSYHHGDLKNALIQAGISVLAKEGVEALSLRKLARKAGVSHAAPYAHFTDKQELIAAIATEGYKKLYQRIHAAQHDDPIECLIATVWAYGQFALQEPDHFKVTFSGVVEHEYDYPEYIEQSRKSLALLVSIVERGQEAHVLPTGDAEMLAVSLWSGIHGVITLYLGNQLPSSHSLLEILLFQLQFFVLVPLPSMDHYDWA